MANRYCGNCGQELPEDVRFCPNCGRPVHETAQVPTPEADVDVPPPPQQARTAGQWQTATPEAPLFGGTQQRSFARRHPILLGCLGLVGVFFLLIIVVGVIGAAVGGGGDQTAGSGGGGGGGQQVQEQAVEGPQVQEQADEGQQEEQAANNPPPRPEYTVGQSATVGNVEWMITDAYRTTLLKSNFGTQKRGNFVVVEFTFTNNRSEEVTLDPELHMVLKDGEGREFGTDIDAWEFVPTQKNIFLEPVNPGISQDGIAVYEVPPDATGYVLTVDDVEFLEDKTARYDLGTLPTRASG